MINSSLPVENIIYRGKIAQIAFLIIAGLAGSSYAQELNATVEVDKSRITSSSTDYINNLAENIEEYLNEHDWIEPNFRQHEKIDVTIQVTLLSVDDNYNFEANIVVRSMRPIYNSTRQTNVFLFNDENWIFNYTPNRGFVHDELQFDAMTSVLDFYAYLILGYDFDSFSELGGSPYFSEASNIVSIAQSTNANGWSRTGGSRRNRAQLVADLLNPNFVPYRKALYSYHRLGLDQFLNNRSEAREHIITAFEQIRSARRNTTNNLLFNTFFNAKFREIVSIFEDAPADIRLRAYNILTDIDQSHLTEYDKLQ